jgi:histone-lysine N-methyltransferase SETMAR
MVSKEHLRHSLLFIFDAMRSGLISGQDEGKTAEQWINTIHGEGTISKSTCAKWFAEFRKGNRSLEDTPHIGRPSTIDDATLKSLVLDDSTLTPEDLAVTFGCDARTIRRHLHSAGLVPKHSRWVPHELSDRQKEQRVQAATELLRQYEGGSLVLDDIVTGDESMVLYVNVGRKTHWGERGKPSAPIAKGPLHPKKAQLCVWWTSRGVAYWELLPGGEGGRINAKVYCEQLEAMVEGLRRGPTKEGGRVHPYKKPYLLLHDNAKPHTAGVTVGKINELNLKAIMHPAYSPDLARLPATTIYSAR